jgi:8-oxo-dGTP pyrophosphatase MutT (NUDIX family)
MRLPFSVQVFLLARQGAAWSVLLLQRNARPELALADFWQGISGALEPGESFEAAAIREVHEETAISLSCASDTGFEQVFPIRPEWRAKYGPEPMHVREKVFYAVVPGKVQPKLSHEHKAFRWCSEEQSLALLTFANNAQCAQAVFRALGDAKT